MKLKFKLSLFNIISKLILVLILWFTIPVIIKKVIYKNTDKNLLEKKEKFIQNLDSKEIKDFLLANDSTETYGNFSILHNEFIELEVAKNQTKVEKNTFLNDTRKIDNEESDYRILKYNFVYNKLIYQLEIGSSLKEIDSLIVFIHYLILIVFVVLAILTYYIDTVLISHLLKPFYRIVESKIKLINSPEKYSHIPVESTTKEFIELDSALENMMNRINEVFLKEKQFIGNVSHELLTPIAILKNRFENLIQNQLLDDTSVDKISDSLNTLDSMKKVISNLLLISRIDNNQFKTDELIDFKEITLNILSNLEDRIEIKNISVEENINHKFRFYGNKTLIQILMTNLLSNAIKYNNQNGKISIKDDFSNDQYSIMISDTGIGLTKEQISTIFNRFTRINFEQEGQGIGLALVDSIAKLHTIEIQVTSAINQGTTFTLFFQNTQKLNKT